MSYNYDEERSVFTFCWKIENFSMGMPYRKKWLYSSLLTIPFVRVSWKIMLHPNFEGNKYVSIYLRQIYNDQTRENKDYSITLSVLSSNDSKQKFISRSGSIDKLDYWGSKEFIAWNLLKQEKEIWLPEDTFTIECRIQPYIEDEDSFYSLLRGINKLYNKENRYPPPFLIGKCSTNVSKQNLETEEGILNDCSSQVIPNKYYRTPVLHSWFQYLYSKKLDSISFCSLGSVVEKTMSKNMKVWSNVVPTKWTSRLCLKKDIVSFTWYIKQFSHLNLYDKFFSPAFHCGSSDWKLMFFLSKGIDESEVAEIFICPMSLYLNSKKIIKCKISVVNRYGRLPLSEELVHLYDNNGQWQFPTFIRNKILFDEKHLYLANDILCLYCTFSISEVNYECKQPWMVVEYSAAFRARYIALCRSLQLREDVLTLLETGLYSDITLKVGQSEIPAHQSILSERSLEFRILIKCLNKTESKGKMVIEIRDLEEETLKKLLKYIYSGKYDFYCNDNRIIDVILAGQRYGVDVEIMEKYLEFREFSNTFKLLKPLAARIRLIIRGEGRKLLSAYLNYCTSLFDI